MSINNAKKNITIVFLFLIIVLVVIIFSVYSQYEKNKITKRTDFVLDTFVTISIYNDFQISELLSKKNTLYNEEILSEAFRKCKEYELLLSRTLKTSDIYKINISKGTLTEVSEETVLLIQTAKKYNELSNGKFDITLGELSALWDFKRKNPSVPDISEIEFALKNSGMNNINNDNSVQLSNPYVQLDLGGIAKGYIADKLSDFLKSKGIKNATINLGGNIITIGDHFGKGWKVGIQKPFSLQEEIVAKISINEKSVVTSGIYQRFFESDGIIYHHILDNKTGFPVQNDVASATIISDKSIDGDCLSTTVLAMGLNDGINLIESLDGIEVILLDKNNKFHYTSGISYNKENNTFELVADRETTH